MRTSTNTGIIDSLVSTLPIRRLLRDRHSLDSLPGLHYGTSRPLFVVTDLHAVTTKPMHPRVRTS